MRKNRTNIMKLFLTLLIFAFIGFSAAYAQEMQIKRDSIAITTADNKVYQNISKYEYDLITAKAPELWQFNRVIISPDSLYISLSRINKINDLFRGESGKDDYFVWYAWFLKNEIGVNIYQQQRDTLLQIYTILQSAISKIAGGGTYFGHNYKRASAYIEYGIYSHHHYQDSIMDVNNLVDRCDKEDTLDGVWQMLSLYNKGNEVPLQEQAERLHYIHEYIEQLDFLLTNDFYIKWLQELVNNFVNNQ